jgi:ribosomal protein S18 acetylase RimI-like enzyme
MVADTAVGMIWVRLWRGPDQGYGYVRDDITELVLAVIPDCRGQGIGTQLLQKLLETAPHHFPAVSLNVRVDNPARRLYERLGFVPVPDSERVNRVGASPLSLFCHFRQRK